MIPTVEITAEAVLIQKPRLFPRRPGLLALYVNGKSVGIHVQVSRREAKAMAQEMVDNVDALLLHSGRYVEVYAEAEREQRKLPAKGDKVALAVTIGKYPAGTHGTVVRVDLEDSADKPENTYPVLFCPDGMPNAEIPLAIGEWK